MWVIKLLYKLLNIYIVKLKIVARNFCNWFYWHKGIFFDGTNSIGRGGKFSFGVVWNGADPRVDICVVVTTLIHREIYIYIREKRHYGAEKKRAAIFNHSEISKCKLEQKNSPFVIDFYIFIQLFFNIIAIGSVNNCLNYNIE